jgi:hypothetical protein
MESIDSHYFANNFIFSFAIKNIGIIIVNMIIINLYFSYEWSKYIY